MDLIIQFIIAVIMTAIISYGIDKAIEKDLSIEKDLTESQDDELTL